MVPLSRVGAGGIITTTNSEFELSIDWKIERRQHGIFYRVAEDLTRSTGRGRDAGADDAKHPTASRR